MDKDRCRRQQLSQKVCFVPCSHLEDLQPVYHGVEPLTEALQLGRVEEQEGDELPQHVAAPDIQDLKGVHTRVQVRVANNLP